MLPKMALPIAVPQDRRTKFRNAMRLYPRPTSLQRDATTPRNASATHTGAQARL